MRMARNRKKFRRARQPAIVAKFAGYRKASAMLNDIVRAPVRVPMASKMAARTPLERLKLALCRGPR